MDWDGIWLKKGNENITDLRTLNGYDVCNFKFTGEDTVNSIINHCSINKSDKILEIGSGAGRLGIFFLNKKYNYYAVERSESLVNKFKLLVDKNKIELNKTNILPFEDNSFDVVFCWSIIQYFNTFDDFHKLLNEMLRVSKKTVLLGDIYEYEDKKKKKYKYKSNNLKHLCIKKEYILQNIPQSVKCNICNFNNSSDVRYNCLIHK